MGQVAEETRLVQDLGFAIGDHIKRKDKLTAVICGFEKGRVRLEVDQNVIATVSAKSFLKKEWAKYVPRKEDVPIEAGTWLLGTF